MDRRSPLSIDDILRKKRLAQDAADKPKFLTKAQREKLALKRQSEEDEKSISLNHVDSVSKSTPSTLVKKKSLVDRFPASVRGSSQGGSSESRKKSEPKKPMVKSSPFTFQWDVEKEDTLNDTDYLYGMLQARPARSVGLSATGGSATVMTGAEERRRRQLVLEAENERKRAKITYEDLHWSEKPLDKMTDRDWRIFKEDFEIVTKGGAIPNPIRYWSESGIPQAILDTIDSLGYKDPTPVQRAAIPIALGVRDVIGVAQTGSGKTASFIIPLLSYIIELPRLNPTTKVDGPYGIILAPTRELAQQIELEAQRFCTPLGFRCVSLVGGHSMEEQSFKLDEGAEIVVATPGRLMDCLDRRILVLQQCCYVVMDEADRMIDFGFEDQVNKILDALPVSNLKPDTEDIQVLTSQSKLLGGKERYRQTMMYTATLPPSVEKLARKYLRCPANVIIGSSTGEAGATVQQVTEFIATYEKRKSRVLAILSDSRNRYQPPVIIFVNHKHHCDELVKAIHSIGWNAVTYHGSKSQVDRERALAQLRSGQAEVLVATDVAGRGIDIPDVSLVINYEMSKKIDAYIHRIGRTGRAGKSGTAITFLGEEDDPVLYDLRNIIRKSKISRVSDELNRHPAAKYKIVTQAR